MLRHICLIAVRSHDFIFLFTSHLYPDWLDGEQVVVHNLEQSHARREISHGVAVQRGGLEAL